MIRLLRTFYSTRGPLCTRFFDSALRLTVHHERTARTSLRQLAEGVRGVSKLGNQSAHLPTTSPDYPTTDYRSPTLPIGSRRVDFFVENSIMVEIKAITRLEDVHLAQALNYLECYKIHVGLLLNFGQRSLEFKRVHNKKNRDF